MIHKSIAAQERHTIETYKSVGPHMCRLVAVDCVLYGTKTSSGKLAASGNVALFVGGRPVEHMNNY